MKYRIIASLMSFSLSLGASSLTLNVSSGLSPTPGLNSFQSLSSATSSSVLTYSDSQTATLPPFVTSLTQDTTVTQSANGRARFGDLGVQLNLGISGSYASTGQGYIQAIYADSLSFSILSGTPQYLQLDIDISGSGSAANLSGWNAQAQLDFGANARIYFVTECNNSLQGIPTCQGRFGLNPTNSSSPIFQSTGSQVNQSILVPFALIQPTNGSFAISSSLYGFARASQSGLLGASTPASASVDYFNSSKLGSFRILDASLQDLQATFTSESGFDYTQAIAQQAVPEPSTYAMIVFGMGFVALWRKRSMRVH